jgi:hypothetical protein
MGRFEQIPTHPPQNSRCSVANVDNQGLNPLHEPLQTVAHSRYRSGIANDSGEGEWSTFGFGPIIAGGLIWGSVGVAKNNPARGRFRRAGRGVNKTRVLPRVVMNIPSLLPLSTAGFALWKNEPHNAFPAPRSRVGIRLAENRKAKPNANTRTLPPSPGSGGTGRPDKCLVVKSLDSSLRPVPLSQHGIHRHHHQGVEGQQG